MLLKEFPSLEIYSMRQSIEVFKENFMQLFIFTDFKAMTSRYGPLADYLVQSAKEMKPQEPQVITGEELIDLVKDLVHVTPGGRKELREAVREKRLPGFSFDFIESIMVLMMVELQKNTDRRTASAKEMCRLVQERYMKNLKPMHQQQTTKKQAEQRAEEDSSADSHIYSPVSSACSKKRRIYTSSESSEEEPLPPAEEESQAESPAIEVVDLEAEENKEPEAEKGFLEGLLYPEMEVMENEVEIPTTIIHEATIHCPLPEEPQPKVAEQVQVQVEVKAKEEGLLKVVETPPLQDIYCAMTRNYRQFNHLLSQGYSLEDSAYAVNRNYSLCQQPQAARGETSQGCSSLPPN